MVSKDLKEFLDSKVAQYNRLEFIENDPVCIPHSYSKQEDIEITAFWTAILAWGQRKTIISKCRELFQLMDNSPHDFILNHQDRDLKTLLKFKHRTFNSTDTLYFVHFLKNFYLEKQSLEDAFVGGLLGENAMESALTEFHDLFFSLEDYPARTRKHIATPARNSACKRINMFLRWMVREDKGGVDFGLWKRIKMSQLICPCDVHVDRVARRLGLITRKKTDWHTAVQLTENLRMLDIEDPVKYDFALFGLGLEDKF